MSFTVVIWKCSHNFGLDIVSQNPSIMKSGSFFITLAKLFKNSCTKIRDRGVGQVLRRREITSWQLLVRRSEKRDIQGSHSTWKTWKTWKNESTPGKPGNIMEFCKI